MNNPWAFIPMRASDDLIGDVDALRDRLDEDSYLYFPQLLDADRVLELRAAMVRVLNDKRWILGGEHLMDAISVIQPLREGEDAFFEVYDEMQRLQLFHELAHDAVLVELMRQVVGPSAFPHPLKITRLAFPFNYEVTTPPHQDYPNNQGTPNLTAAWVPVGDVAADAGGLAVLRGSHRYGVLPLERHPGAGNRQAVVPLEMLEKLRWVTTDFRLGDVLLFPSTTVHASLHNASDSMRISVDFRYQCEGEALTPIVLEPHFGRLTWEQVYDGWTSDRYQYYWRDLDYEVVPFEEFPLASDLDPDTPWAEILRHDRRLRTRHERRMERLGPVLGGQAPGAGADGAGDPS